MADANEKNRQLETERKKNAKERKDLEDEIALLRSGLYYSGSKSQQSGRSVEEVGANDGRENFDGTDASLPEGNRKGDASSESNTDEEKSDNSQARSSQSEDSNSSSEDKGSEILKLVLPALKERALAPGSNVNVDETWERYQTHFGHRKTYMWCLVNRKANIVIDDLIDIEHLCCLAHVRAKLERAERMGCKEAVFLGRLLSRYTHRSTHGCNAMCANVDSSCSTI